MKQFVSMPLISGKPDLEKESVILIHGMKSTGRSMHKIQVSLESYNYNVIVCSYESNKAINEITVELFDALAPIIRSSPKVHFVTHSLGGIILRNFLKDNMPQNLGNVVMLGPPNKGSQHIDYFSRFSFFTNYWGPPSKELGTKEDSLPNILPDINFHCGIIAGSKKGIIGLILPGDNDGKVTIDSAFENGASELLVLPVNHTEMLKDNDAISNLIHFLKCGKFLFTSTNAL